VLEPNAVLVLGLLFGLFEEAIDHFVHLPDLVVEVCLFLLQILLEEVPEEVIILTGAVPVLNLNDTTYQLLLKQTVVDVHLHYHRVLLILNFLELLKSILPLSLYCIPDELLLLEVTLHDVDVYGLVHHRQFALKGLRPLLLAGERLPGEPTALGAVAGGGVVATI